VRPPAVCLLLCLLHGIPASTHAQDSAMPGWLVPVLRLVSATHVKPTTGVVLSDEGLVLVPADFAAPGDEIIVLDGGTDIIRNGRPARIEKGFPDFGLEVLRVEGLRRNGAPVAPDAPANGSRVTLRAFPPAELIADGAPPVSVTTAISIAPDSGVPALAAGDSLPNVTGALLDECGNLAGLSLADGAQSLDPVATTRYHWSSALRTVLADLGLPVSGRPCTASAVAAETSPQVEEQPTEPEFAEPPTAAGAPEQAAAEEPLTEEPTTAETVEEEPLIEALPPFENDGTVDEPLPTPPEEPPAPLWPWLVGALMLFAGGVVVHWLRRRRAARHDAANGALPATTAPAHARPVGGQDPSGSITGPVVRILLRGELADGREVETAAEASAEAINLEVGRGDVDLVVDSQAVSRRHARLNGSSESLTLTDLGSSNGTAINGIPCLEGEIMYLESGDTLILGDALMTVTIEAVPRGGTSA
jgi:hypothetical protein